MPALYLLTFMHIKYYLRFFEKSLVTFTGMSTRAENPENWEINIYKRKHGAASSVKSLS